MIYFAGFHGETGQLPISACKYTNFLLIRGICVDFLAHF